MSIGYWNISCLSEVYQWCFQSTKADFILGRHGRGRPQKLWNRGPLECDHPKDRPLPVLTLRSAQEFTVTAETASPQVNVHKKRAHTHTHRNTHADLGSEPCFSSPPSNLDGESQGNLSSPSDLQNVLGLSYRTALSARCQINSHIIFSLKGENN